MLRLLLVRLVAAVGTRGIGLNMKSYGKKDNAAVRSNGHFQNGITSAGYGNTRKPLGITSAGYGGTRAPHGLTSSGYGGVRQPHGHSSAK